MYDWAALVARAKSISIAVAGWVFGFVVLLRKLITETINGLVKRLANLALKHLAGSSVVNWLALARYRRSLWTKLNEVRVPFRPEKPLVMSDLYVDLYVPLTVAESRHTQDKFVHATEAIATCHRCVVLGPPGSGKTLLLRQIAFQYGLGRPLRKSDVVPVYLALSRLAESTADIIGEIVGAFARDDFPESQRFVDGALERGGIYVLFDGLDEVPSAKREHVVWQVKDFLAQHPRCPSVITCRTAVYYEDFLDAVDRRFVVAEFDDYQIMQFLGNWQKDMPEGKSIQQLVNTLLNSPQLMALARNPLLLTIIAFLYCDTDFVLPNSRADFYNQAIDFLVRRLKVERNKFDAGQKRLVLQRLAQCMQSPLPGQDEDGRTMARERAIAEIRTLLPSLSADPQSAADMLREIVERSGLLLLIDGDTRLTFAHLTLQEYLSSCTFKTWQPLLKNYREQPDRWREVLRLWCSAENDSTELVSALEANDPLMAFECVAESRMLEAEVATRLMTTVFRSIMAKDAWQDEVVSAIGNVAASPQARGRKAFLFLQGILCDAKAAPSQRFAAASALSKTNLPTAAAVLVVSYPSDSIARGALVRMGDVAVPYLALNLRNGQLAAATDLGQVGTPLAATHLVSALVNSDPRVEEHAAVSLGQLIARPSIEQAISRIDIDKQLDNAEQLDWVWAPFSARSTPSMTRIAGRVAYLLFRSPSHIPSLEGLDPRLLIPLAVVGRQRGPSGVSKPGGALRHTEEEPCAACSEFLNKEPPGLFRSAVDALAVPIRCALIAQYRSHPYPTDEHWRLLRISSPADYLFSKSRSLEGAWALLVLAGILCCFSEVTGAVLLGSSPSGIAPSRLVQVFLGYVEMVVSAVRFVEVPVWIALCPPAFGIAAPFWICTQSEFNSDRLRNFILLFVSGSALIIAAPVASLGFGLLIAVGATCIVIGGLATWLVYLGKRKERVSRNPLHGILELSSSSSSESVYARTSETNDY